MRAYSLKKAKEMVAAFNRLGTSEQAAVELNLPVSDVRKIITWLDTHDPCNRRTDDDDAPGRLSIPTSHIWLVWLYENNVSPRTAAVCVNWPYARVLTTCGGEEEWLKICGRAKVSQLKPAKKELLDRLPDDPTPEEILARAAEIPRRANNEQAKRVEIKEFFYDRRTMSFEVPS